MRSLLSSIHLRTEADVAPVVCPTLSARAWIAPAINGWTSVFDESLERLEADAAESLARQWSAALGVAALAVNVFGDDSFVYALHEGGTLLERRHITEGTDRESELHGPLALVRYCAAGTTEEALLRILAGPAPQTAPARSPDPVRVMLERSTEAFRTLPPEIVDQLLSQVQAQVPEDHPMMEAFRANRQQMLDMVAQRSEQLREETDRMAHQAQTTMEPGVRLLGPTATIPTRLDALATLLGLTERVPLTFSMITDPEDEGWRQVVHTP